MLDDAPRPAAPRERDLDPLVVHARREMVLTLIVWAVFAVWVIGVSWWRGRAPTTEADGIDTVLGIPSWVFWGVALPWIAANVFTFWFCFGYMAEDRLETAVEETAFSNPRPDGKESSS